MTEKVIEFPKHKVVRDVPGDVIDERNRRADLKVADAMVTEITSMIITELDNYCLNIEDESFTKDLVLLVDALRATIYRQFDIDHHLHPYIEKNVKLISKKQAEAMEDMSSDQIKAMIEDLMKNKETVDNDDTE